MNLNLNNQQAVLVEAALSLFLESLIGSQGALEALKKEGNPDNVVLKQIDEELSEAKFAIEQIGNILNQFENNENKNSNDITKKPDWL